MRVRFGVIESLLTIVLCDSTLVFIAIEIERSDGKVTRFFESGRKRIQRKSGLLGRIFYWEITFQFSRKKTMED